MLVKASDLRMKDVVNTVDGRRLGYVYDLDVDVKTGQILSIYLPGPGGWLWFMGRGADIEIPWNKVVKVGVDVVLVAVPELSDPMVYRGR